MSIRGGGQGNVAFDLNDRVVERKLAQGTRHGVAIELQTLTHLGQRRRTETRLVEGGHDALARLAHHTYRRSGRVRVEHLGTVDGAHAARTALENERGRDVFARCRPGGMRDLARRETRLLGRGPVHGGQRDGERGEGGIEHSGGGIELLGRALGTKRHGVTRGNRPVQERSRLGTRKIESTGCGRGRHGQALQPQPCGNGGGAVVGIQGPEQRALARGEDARAATPRKKNTTAADKHHRREREHNEAVARSHGKALLQTDLHDAGLASLNRTLTLHEHDSAEDLRRARHHMHARTGLEGRGLGALAPQIREAGDEPERRALGTRPAEDLATRKVARTVAHDVERRALSGQRPRSITMHLNRAHAAAHARGT